MSPFPELPLFGGYLPTSFLDWEGRVTAVIFLKGCNFRCPFCHNAPLVTGMAEGLETGPVLADILRRKKFLDGVAVSGGEPTIYSSLEALLGWVREVAGLPVKLDTNGSNPSLLSRLLEKRLVDAAAMDVKAPWDKYGALTGVEVDTRKIMESLEILDPLGDSLELRTTFVPDLMTLEDLVEIHGQLGKDPRWVVQLFEPDKALAPSLRESRRPERGEVIAVLKDVRVRG